MAKTEWLVNIDGEIKLRFQNPTRRLEPTDISTPDMWRGKGSSARAMAVWLFLPCSFVIAARIEARLGDWGPEYTQPEWYGHGMLRRIHMETLKPSNFRSSIVDVAPQPHSFLGQIPKTLVVTDGQIPPRPHHHPHAHHPIPCAPSSPLTNQTPPRICTCTYHAMHVHPCTFFQSKQS
jgi:hypothetical protein